MWKVKTGEQAPFWCMLLVFTQADLQCFMPPIIVCQAKYYSQDLHFNITLDWIFHHIPYGYMDRYRWLKSMTQFSNVCSVSPFKNKIIFFGGHDSHFYHLTLIHMEQRNIQPFVIKSGKLESILNQVKSEWMLKYGTTKMLPHHMKSIFVVFWDAFKVSDGTFIS